MMKWLRLQIQERETRVSKPSNGFAQAQKASFYFYLGAEKSVKNEEENKQKGSIFSNPSPKRDEEIKPLPQPLPEEGGE